MSDKTKSVTWKGFVKIKTKSVTGVGFVSYKTMSADLSAQKAYPSNGLCLLLTKPQQNSRQCFVTHKTYASN